MITPPPLQKADTIALASPARSVEPSQIRAAIDFYERHGFKLRVDPEVFAVYRQFGGSDAQRAAHFNRLLADPQVKAIIANRGGYGCNRTAEGIDFDLLRKNPKWVIGYSDISLIHAAIFEKAGLLSLHAPMAKELGEISPLAEKALVETLCGKAPSYTFERHPMNKNGIAEGRLIGGNLSVLYSLAAAGRFPDPKDNILFIEDVDEYLYHIDRMMISLKQAGIFKQISGLLVGAFTKINDNEVPFGMTVEEIIREHCDANDIPVAFGFEAGHEPQNLCLVLGCKSRLEVLEGKASILKQTFDY